MPSFSPLEITAGVYCFRLASDERDKMTSSVIAERISSEVNYLLSESGLPSVTTATIAAYIDDPKIVRIMASMRMAAQVLAETDKRYDRLREAAENSEQAQSIVKQHEYTREAIAFFKTQMEPPVGFKLNSPVVENKDRKYLEDGRGYVQNSLNPAHFYNKKDLTSFFATLHPVPGSVAPQSPPAGPTQVSSPIRGNSATRSRGGGSPTK
ncbi:hypothetical protein AB0911_38160 [Streptomyces nigra]|uniref:hypothetical protein n=1 Tax=Streptomyces nigra TaxID=1827580 RepID=UPI00345640D4